MPLIRVFVRLLGSLLRGAGFGAVFVMLVPVRGLQSLPGGNRPTSGETQWIGTCRDDFVAWEYSIEDFDAVATDLTRPHRGAMEKVGAVEIGDKDMPVCRTTLERGAWDAQHSRTAAQHDIELDPHAGAHPQSRIVNPEDCVDGASGWVRSGAETQHFPLNRLGTERRHDEMGTGTRLELARVMLGHTGDGPHFSEVGDIQ